MKKKMAVMMAVVLAFSMLAGCSIKEKQDPEEQAVDTPAITEKENPAQEETQELIPDPEKKGAQQETVGSVSFSYNADLLSMNKNVDGANTFVVSLLSKEDPSIVPQINLIGIDTSSLNGEMTEEEYGELCSQLLQQYYTDPQTEVEVQVMQLDLSDPANRIAEATLSNKASEGGPAIDAKMKLLYNEANGVMVISMFEKDMSQEEQVPFEEAYQSVVLN